MTLTQLYIFTVILPNAYEAFNFLGEVLAIAAIICWVISFLLIDKPNDAKSMVKTAVKLSIIAAITGLIAIPLPNERQLYTFAGGYVATNTQDIAKLPENVVKAANAWLEKASEKEKK